MQKLITTKEAFSRRYFENSQDLAGPWDAVGQIGAAVVSNLFSAAGSSGQARGLAAIEAFGQQALQTLAQIAQMVQSGQLPRDQAVQEASRIASLLSNSQYVYQAQRGSDAAALRNYKEQAAAMVQQIQNMAGAAPAGRASGSTVSLNATPVLLIGGGLLLVLLLK